MDITPDPHLLESKVNDRLGWHDCLAELIDNSFDAGANQVVISLTGKTLKVQDDGCGIESITSAVRLGQHQRRKSTKLGRYGVGLKDAWLWLSDGFTLRTTRGGITTTCSIARSKVEFVDGRWIVPDPESRAALPGERGTTLTFGPLSHNRTKPEQQSIDKLALTFMPALLSNRQIVVERNGQRRPLKAYKIPAMQRAITETFDVEGKSVAIEIGIAQDGERIIEHGFCLCYEHRVIKMTTIGTGQFSANRMVGKICLGHGWNLTPHKNDFAEYSDELGNAIFQRIEQLLISAESMSEDLESNAIKAELERMVNQSLAGAKGREKRGRGVGEAGTKMPTNSGRRRRKAKEVDFNAEGSVELSGENGQQKRRGIQIKWAEMDEDLLGKYEPEAKSVTLNLSNEFTASMKVARNTAALYAVAIGLICHYDDTTDDEKHRLMICKGGFSRSWGIAMASLTFKQEKANV